MVETINQEVKALALQELLDYAKNKEQRNIQGIIEQGALAGKTYLNIKGNSKKAEVDRAKAAKKLWVCNYTLVNLLTGENMKVEFYTINEKNDYYEFEYLDEKFVKNILTFNKSSGFNIEEFSKLTKETKGKYKKTEHSKKEGQILANALFEATKNISKAARDAKDEGEVASTEYAKLLGLGYYKDNDDTIYPVQVNYGDGIQHYIYIKYSVKEIKDSKKAVGQTYNPTTKQKAYYFHYYGETEGFDSSKYYNYGWLREHSLEIARNQSSNDGITHKKIRDTFTEKTENIPGYRIGDVNYSQIKYNNRHLMGLDTVEQLANMFQEFQIKGIYDEDRLRKSFYSSTATMQLDQMLDDMTTNGIDTLIKNLDII